MPRRRTAAPAPVRPACAPVGDLTRWPAETFRCADEQCPAVLHHVRAGAHLNDWTMVDESGRATRDDRPELLITDPKRWWDELTAAMLGGDDRAGNLYSLMSTGGDFAGRRWIHQHRCGPRTHPRPDREPPFCCAQPMWASPDGWACRVSGLIFAV